MTSSFIADSVFQAMRCIKAASYGARGYIEIAISREKMKGLVGANRMANPKQAATGTPTHTSTHWHRRFTQRFN
jgi:hypothetical protein